LNAFGDVWEWDGATWHELVLDGDPIVRWAAAAAYDGVRRQIVLFGGYSLAGPTLGDTQVFDFRSTQPVERCFLNVDEDGDGYAGCVDPDCWARCSPQCSPGVVFDPTKPHCGDGTCSAVEDHMICPADC